MTYVFSDWKTCDYNKQIHLILLTVCLICMRIIEKSGLDGRWGEHNESILVSSRHCLYLGSTSQAGGRAFHYSLISSWQVWFQLAFHLSVGRRVWSFILSYYSLVLGWGWDYRRG